jgi:hypothetical protein
VSAYDVLGSVMAMPLGALIAGPLGAAIGISAAQYAAAAVIVVASALALIPRDVRAMRSNDSARPEDEPLGHALEETVALGAIVPGITQDEILAAELEGAPR